KGDEPCGERVDEVVVDRSRAQQGGEETDGREAAHPYHVVDDASLAFEANRPVLPGRHRQHAQVHPRREATVQPHLLLAEVPALLDRAEVEEWERDRLLQLVDVWAGEEDVRDVSL